MWGPELNCMLHKFGWVIVPYKFLIILATLIKSGIAVCSRLTNLWSSCGNTPQKWHGMCVTCLQSSGHLMATLLNPGMSCLIYRGLQSCRLLWQHSSNVACQVCSWYIEAYKLVVILWQHFSNVACQVCSWYIEAYKLVVILWQHSSKMAAIKVRIMALDINSCNKTWQ